jgi:TRAP transporter TAXI family solute receptor
MDMRRMLTLVFALFVFVPGTFDNAYSAENWALGSSGAGSGPYMWGGKVAKHINTCQKDISISSQATAGFNENVELVSGGQIQLGLQDATVLTDAYDGTGPFQGHPQKRVRVLFTVVVAPWHMVTREASKIQTIFDLKGKKVNIGLPAQGTRVYNEAVLKAANIGLSGIKMFEMATGQSFKALQDGIIDASGNLFSVGHGGLLELANSTPIRLVGLPDDLLERFVEEIGGVVKFVIPANTYKGQDSPVSTFGGVVVLFARDDLSNDKAYEVTKAFWENLAELNKDRSFKDLSKDQAFIKNLKVPYHPGALKYMTEAGLYKK